jgi:hypothetical protein
MAAIAERRVPSAKGRAIARRIGEGHTADDEYALVKCEEAVFKPEV